MVDWGDNDEMYTKWGFCKCKMCGKKFYTPLDMFGRAAFPHDCASSPHGVAAIADARRETYAETPIAESLGQRAESD